MSGPDLERHSTPSPHISASGLGSAPNARRAEVDPLAYRYAGAAELPYLFRLHSAATIPSRGAENFDRGKLFRLALQVLSRVSNVLQTLAVRRTVTWWHWHNASLIESFIDDVGVTSGRRTAVPVSLAACMYPLQETKVSVQD